MIVFAAATQAAGPGATVVLVAASETAMAAKFPEVHGRACGSGPGLAAPCCGPTSDLIGCPTPERSTPAYLS
jgi:hypothetical protein